MAGSIAVEAQRGRRVTPPGPSSQPVGLKRCKSRAGIGTDEAAGLLRSFGAGVSFENYRRLGLPFRFPSTFDSR